MDLDLENSLALKGLEVHEEVDDSHEHENPVRNMLDYSSSDDNGSDDDADDNVDDNVVDDNADNVSTTSNLEITSLQQEGTDLDFRRTSLSKSYLERPGLTKSSFSTYKTIQIPVNTATGGGGLTAYFAVALHTDSQPTTLFLENSDIFQEDFIFMASIESAVWKWSFNTQFIETKIKIKEYYTYHSLLISIVTFYSFEHFYPFTFFWAFFKPSSFYK
jgi:hypothetical protein